MILDTGGPAVPRECHARERDSEAGEGADSQAAASRQLEAQIAALAARQAEIENQLRQLSERESRVAAAEDELLQARSRFAAQQQASVDEHFTTVGNAAAVEEQEVTDVDPSEVLARLQAAGIWREGGRSDEPAELTIESTTTVRATEVRRSTTARDDESTATELADGADAAPEPREGSVSVRHEETRSETASSSVSPGHQGGDDDDLQESIDRYMERLLNRSASKTTTPAPKPPQPAQIETHEPSVPRWTAPTASSATTTLDLEPAPQRKPLKPARTIAPERQCDLAAMRELANASAKAHLAQYARDERRSMLQTKLSVLVVSLVSAIFLLVISPRGSTPWCGGIVSLLVAGFWGLQVAVITGNLTIDAQGGLLITRAREKSSKLAQRLRRAK